MLSPANGRFRVDRYNLVAGVETLQVCGGITRTDDVANGIVQALDQSPPSVPLVIRLTGTNEEQAVKILAARGLSAMTDMDAAVQQAVKLGAAA